MIDDKTTDSSSDEPSRISELTESSGLPSPGLERPVLNEIRRRESIAHAVGFAWGGVLEMLHAIADWIASIAKPLADQDDQGADP